MKSYKNIVFQNNFHNGDLHYSREFVKYFIKHTNAENYYYIHHNSPRLMMDIPEFTAHGSAVPESLKPWETLDLQAHTQEIGDTLYINTWVGRHNLMYHSRYNSCTIEANYEAFKDTCSELGLSRDVGPIENFIPEYDYTPFSTENIDNFFNTRHTDKMKVLICNGECRSGQASNFDMSPAIGRLCTEYPNVLFLIANESHTLDYSHPNISYTSDIIKLQFGDLVENSYLSRFCDIIVGRASGAFCFACTKEIWNSNKTIISFSQNEKEGMWAENSTGLWSDTRDSNQAFNIISQEINKRL